jgi:glycosyltransferase involved in cell wall biosynthesis
MLELVSVDNGFLFESVNAHSLAQAMNWALHMSVEKYEHMARSCVTFASANLDLEDHGQRLLQLYVRVAK